ncbi:coiled-coil domain-containing protein [Helicobacter salomonis]|uniref:hypothetical protein n=1 Tax=Helicobacter salomonis TaxID=56878 RepID=UPI000CF0D5D3|nr:hypothetical protein [Helicobacter salomonis]
MKSVKISLDLKTFAVEASPCDFDVGDMELRLSLQRSGDLITACVSKCGGGGVDSASQTVDCTPQENSPPLKFQDCSQHVSQPCGYPNPTSAKPKEEIESKLAGLEVFIEDLAKIVLGTEVTYRCLSLKEQQDKIQRTIQAIVNLTLKTPEPKPTTDILNSKLYQDLQRVLEIEREKNKSFGDKIFGILRLSKTDSSDPEAQLNELENQLKTIIRAQDLETELDDEERALLEPHELEALNTKPRTLLEELQLQMSKKKAKIKALNKKVEKREKEIKELKGELKDAKEDLEKGLESAKKAHEDKKKELEGEITRLNGMSDRQLIKIKNLETEKNDLSTQKDDLNTQLGATRKEKADLEKERASLNTALKNKETEITGLKAQAQKDSAEISTLKEQVSQKEEQIRGLNDQNTQLKVDMGAQENQKQKAEAELQALQQRYARLDPLLNLQALVHQSPTIARRLEIAPESDVSALLFSKLFKNPPFILEVIAKEIAKNPADQDILIDFFETLFAMPLPGRLERLQVQEGDKFDPQLCQMRDTSQSIQGSVIKVLFQGYKEEGKIKHKSLVDVR